MPLPKLIAKSNRWTVIPVARRFAGRLPPFAIVEHWGRVSGKLYRTPIMAFRTPAGFLIALTYGPNTEWVRNVFARGGCVLEDGGRRIETIQPALRHEPPPRSLPLLVRIALSVMRVNDFLTLERAQG